MYIRVFKFHFITALHIGDGRLADALFQFSADSLFSALCHEALKINGVSGIEELVSWVLKDGVRFSDLMPFAPNDYYIPKPIMAFDYPKDKKQAADSSVKKAYKRLEYLPIDLLPDYMEHTNFDPAAAKMDLNSVVGGKSTSAFVNIREKDSMPFSVGTFTFRQDAGLYLITQARDKKTLDKIYELLQALSYSGIGGKRSAGLGRFEISEATEAGDEFDLADGYEESAVNSANRFMTLCTSMAKETEIDNALEGATYSMKRRSGFVSSKDYSESFVKKNDFFSFAAGSCFKNTFCGDIFDVSDKNGTHPVYRYAVPMFLKLSM